MSLELDGLRVLSLTDLEGLPILNVADVVRPRKATPTIPPPAGPAPYREGAKNGFLEKRPGRKTQNILGSETPARRRKTKSENFSELEIWSSGNSGLPEPPTFATAVDVTPDGRRKAVFALMPSRVVGDRRLNYTDLRVLLALTCYTSALGICYPNRATLALRIGVAPTAVSRSMTSLQRFGYVRRLVSVGRKYPGAHSRGARWQVLIRGNDPVPPKETVWNSR